MSGYEQTTTYRPKLTRTVSLEATDPSIPYRLVGTYEYKKSLESFERLMVISSKKEFEAYDKLLEERPEFTFFNGANLHLNGKRDLKAASLDEREQFDKSFRKKGLAWMIALAKIELCATESLYGKSKKPFESLPVTRFDAEKFIELLADDAAAHLRSLATEDGFKDVVRKARRIDFLTISYLRRLKLVRDMLTTLESVGKGDVKKRVKEYDKKLAKYERQLNAKVDGETGAQTYDGGTSTKTTNGFEGSLQIGKCSALIKQQSQGSAGSDGGG